MSSSFHSKYPSISIFIPYQIHNYDSINKQKVGKKKVENINYQKEPRQVQIKDSEGSKTKEQITEMMKYLMQLGMQSICIHSYQQK